MLRRFGSFGLAWAFVGPWLRSKLGRPVPYWFFLDVSTACNMRCGYCFVIDPKPARIDLATAKASIDFMHKQGCRVMALMGGEPLLMGERLLEIIEYAANKKMFSYLPTNLSLLNKSFLEDLVKAGVSLIDCGIDSVERREGFEKNLQDYQHAFDSVLECKEKGVLVKMNTVITRQNVDDVYELAEVSRSKEVPISMHLIERAVPGTSEKRYKWLRGDFHFSEADYPILEELADWLIEKKKEKYPISNPVWYFERMKEMVRFGKHSGWNCLAGTRSLFINVEGEFQPCLALIWQKKKWGNSREGGWPLDEKSIQQQLRICNRECLSCANALTAEGHLNPITFIKRYVHNWFLFKRKPR